MLDYSLLQGIEFLNTAGFRFKMLQSSFKI